jgi:hypothetical protein
MYIKSIHYCPVHQLDYPALRLSFFFFFFVLSFGFLSVFCSSNVSIDEGMFGVSIGASKIGLGEFTESNGHVCDDAISGLGASGLVVVKCLQNMALLIMTKLYNGLWVFQANLPSYKHITLKEKYNSSEIAHECY